MVIIHSPSLSQVVKVTLWTLFTMALMACPFSNKMDLKNYMLLEKAAGPTVQVSLQKEQLSLWGDPKSTVQEVWALFTYGGWSDRGQIWITLDHKGAYELSYMEPSRDHLPPKVTPLSTEQVAKISPLGEQFSHLQDFQSVALDGIQYEFIHLVKVEEAFYLRRIFMNNPEHFPESKNHHEAIKSFFALAGQ